MRADFLGELDEPAHALVLAVLRRRRWSKGETIYRQGELDDSLYLVERGRVAMQVGTATGHTATTAVFGPGDSFGHLALLSSRAPRTATALALQPTETGVLTRDAFNDIRERYPQIEVALLQLIAEHVSGLADQLTQAMFTPVERRLLARLVALAPAYAANHEIITVTLTQEELAAMVGTTRPTVNQILRAAEKDGLLRLARGRVELVDIPELRRRSC
jgi:CRP/FNR family cyclic AMP-dependent transcriptional regulator